MLEWIQCKFIADHTCDLPPSTKKPEQTDTD